MTSEKRLQQKRDDYRRHRKKRIATVKKYYEEHREEIKEKQKIRYEKNKDEINEKRREHRNHKTDKEYYERNKKKILERQKNYYQDNKEKVDKSHKEWERNNPEKMRTHWAKRKRKQNALGYISILSNPFPEEIAVDFHHVNPIMPFVIPLPKMTHQHFNMELEKHIEYNNEWIEKIYCFDLDGLIFGKET